MSEEPKRLLWFGIITILITGLIHIIEVSDAFEEAAYKGWFFVANGIGAVITAYGIYRGKNRWAWNPRLLIALGSIAGYTASRTFSDINPDS